MSANGTPQGSDAFFTLTLNKRFFLKVVLAIVLAWAVLTVVSIVLMTWPGGSSGSSEPIPQVPSRTSTP